MLILSIKRRIDMTAGNRTSDPQKLIEFTARILQKLNVPEDDANVTAHLLVATDLRGIESHGVAHLAPFYARRIKEGLINPRPNIKLYSQTPATAVIDGDRGLGFVIGHRAMLEAIERASSTGAGFVSVRNSTHCGAGSIYAIMALSRNMIGIALTTGGIGMEVPGSRGQGSGINVISFAAPAAKEAPFILDMATTVVAGGKLEIALRNDKNIPAGWAVDRAGDPITEPKRYYTEKGALLPLGGIPDLGSYKGFGLGVMVEILCSILSGTQSITQIANQPDSEGRANQFFGALRIDSFIPVDEFKRSMDQMIMSYHSLPKAEGVDKIYLAGEIESALERVRSERGIPLQPSVLDSLRKLANELGVEFDI
jgi:L-2-hydroxycarboxylate dehydrogenase (NAD+)